MSLINSLQHLLASGRLILHASPWNPSEPFQPVFAQSTPLHVLHQVLGVVMKINEDNTMQVFLDSTEAAIVLDIGIHLGNIGMLSESVAWQHLHISILHHMVSKDTPYIAHALDNLSIAYQLQLQFQSALQASRQSLDIWCHICKSLPEVDNQLGHLASLIAHAQNLLKTGQRMAALFIAQNAVALSRPMVDQMIKSSSKLFCLTGKEEFRAACCCDAPFVFATVLASLDQHDKSYEAWKEGFQIMLWLPVFLHSPHRENIGSFLDQICKVAEGGRLSIGILEDCVILFRNLTRIYPEVFSSHFLGLLHAFAYFTQKNNLPRTACSIENIHLRLFLDANLDCPPPILDITRPMQNDLYLHGGVLEDAVRAFYLVPSKSAIALIQNILVSHLDEIICVLQDVVEKLVFDRNIRIIDWVLHTLTGVVTLVTSPSHQIALLQVLKGTAEHFSAILVSRGSEWERVLWNILLPISRHFWRAGLLDEALKVREEVIKYVDSYHVDNMAAATMLQLNRDFILCDMGRFSEGIELIQQNKIIYPKFFLHPYLLQTYIFRRTGRKQEVLHLLRRGLAASFQKYWTGDSKVFYLPPYFLLVELAATWAQQGQQVKALKAAERAVTACRKDVSPGDVEAQKCLLVHSLTVLSNCLAAIERNDEALAVAQEAVCIYTQNAPHMWKDYLYTIRKQELGGNAFHTLSLRFGTLGRPDKALLNSEMGTKLYRELVELAPRHLPTHASSLRNLASLLWDAGRRDKAIVTCEEAVNIMRKVADTETYFLSYLAEASSELARYLTEKSNIGGTSPASAKCVEVQWKFEDSKEAWETVSKAKDKYYDTSEARPSVEEVVSEAAHLAISEFLPTSLTTQTPDGDGHHHLSGGGGGSGIPVGVGDIAIPSATIASIAAASVSLNQNPMTSIRIAAALAEAHGSTDAAQSTETPFRDVLNEPLEVRLSIRSTPMDILWWMLLVILSALLAVVWSRVI